MAPKRRFWGKQYGLPLTKEVPYVPFQEREPSRRHGNIGKWFLCGAISLLTFFSGDKVLKTCSRWLDWFDVCTVAECFPPLPPVCPHQNASCIQERQSDQYKVNKNFDNSISSTYQQKDNIWIFFNSYKIQTNNCQKLKNSSPFKSSNLDRLN